MIRKISCALLGAVLTICSGMAVADGHEQEQEQEQENRFRPIEVFACNYVGGKGMSDLKKVIGKWNAYMDGEKQHDYAAYTMTPVHYSEWAFDVAWVGVWRDGNSMGAGLENYMATGGDIDAEFSKVVNCQSHSLYSSFRMRAGDSNDNNDTQFVAGFSDCSVREGRTMNDAFNAMQKWNAVRDEAGIVGAESWWFPGAGNDDFEADFKAVSVIPDWKTVGANYEKIIMDELWRKRSDTVGEELDCDSGRTYNVTEHRGWGDNG